MNFCLPCIPLTEVQYQTANVNAEGYLVSLGDQAVARVETQSRLMLRLHVEHGGTYSSAAENAITFAMKLSKL